MLKVHLMCPKTNLTYCGYRSTEVQVTNDQKETTCKTCLLREKFNLPVEKPKWE